MEINLLKERCKEICRNSKSAEEAERKILMLTTGGVKKYHPVMVVSVAMVGKDSYKEFTGLMIVVENPDELVSF